MQKTIDSFAAQQLRRDMGDAAFERWKQQNGIVDVASVSQQPAAPTGLSSLLAPVQTPGQEQMAQAGLDAMAPQPMAVQPQMEGVQKPGLFGQGGTGWQILGVLGDALQTAGGGQASYMPYRQAMNQRDEQARQALQELIAQREAKAAERDAALRDKISVIDYQRNNPAPTNDERTLQWWNGLSAEEKAQYAAMQDVRNPIAVSGPTGTYRVPRAYGQQSAAPATRTIGNQTYYNINGEWYDNPEGR